MIHQETLKLLEWSRLCSHLATFATTKMGITAAQNPDIPELLTESQELLSQTEEVYYLEQDPKIKLIFEGIVDIRDVVKIAALGGYLSGKDLLGIAITLDKVRRLRKIVNSYEKLPLFNLKKLVNNIKTYPELEQTIRYCVDENGDITEHASSKLSKIRLLLRELRNEIYQKLQSIINKKAGAIQESLITQRNNRFVIPVKTLQKDQIPGIVHDTSNTGMTVYIEPSYIVDIGNKYCQYLRQETIEEIVILRQLTEKIAEVAESLKYLVEAIQKLDLATARARYSLWLGGNIPQFIEEGETIILRKLYHPLLIWQQKKEQGVQVVPIDIQINSKINVVSITGPNTGGKTVTLKTLGLAALMAKVGLFIPAVSPVKLPWFKNVLADIGDEQSITQNLSTFSSHIRRIILILKAVSNPSKSNSSKILNKFKNCSSLVLLDEVGAGTDPTEGSALAISLLSHLANHALLTIATTHYREIKALKYRDSRFENASVEFNDQTFSPSYRLLWGIPGRSNAISIAQNLGLDLNILQAARNIVGEQSKNVNDIILGLEEQRNKQELKANEAQELLKQAKNFYTEVSDKAIILKEREQELKHFQEKEIQKAISSAKEEIAQVIRHLQQGDKTSQKALQATKEILNISKEKLPQVKKEYSSYCPKIGEKVKITKFGQNAQVLDVIADSQEVVVRFGLMTMKILFTDIESLDGLKLDKPKAKKQSVQRQDIQAIDVGNQYDIRTDNNTLDIRGTRIFEAEISLEKAIAQATNIGVLWIIHGKGTGKLRQRVHEFLKIHPQVKDFKLASQNEGGSGVTLVHLK